LTQKPNVQADGHTNNIATHRIQTRNKRQQSQHINQKCTKKEIKTRTRTHSDNGINTERNKDATISAHRHTITSANDGITTPTKQSPSRQMDSDTRNTTSPALLSSTILPQLLLSTAMQCYDDRATTVTV